MEPVKPGLVAETLVPTDPALLNTPGSSSAPGPAGGVTQPLSEPLAALLGIGFPQVPGYELVGKLGEGGMGVVYKALQKRPPRPVALKMIRGGGRGQERERFFTEAAVIARMQHPHIVQVYEVNECPGADGTTVPYCALEFVAGGSLDRILKAEPQDPRDSAALVRTLALAVQAAHDKNVIHRDLKPANILMAGDPQASRPLVSMTPKVADFGLAKELDLDSGRTRTDAIVGTPYYMAPEQAQGQGDQVGPWTDVHALGAILYEMLIGRPPFKGQTVNDTLEQVCRTEPVGPRRLQPRVPRPLETICLKALRKTPRSRYHSAREMADDLGRFLEGRPILARPVGVLERLGLWARRAPFQAAAGVLLLGVLLLGLAALFLDRDRARKAADLSEERALRSEREVGEQRRLHRIRQSFEESLTQAERADRRDDHVETVRLTTAALKQIEAEPAFQDYPLRAQAQRLRDRARSHLLGQEKLGLLKRHHGDAVFFATLFTGLELADNHERVRRAVQAGLGVFGLLPDGMPAVPVTLTEVAVLCHDLLLLQGEMLARPRPPEPKAAWDARLTEALALLDQADRLGLKATHASQSRRALYLEWLGRKADAERAARAVAETAPDLPADYFFRGLKRYQDEDYPEAIRDLATALKKQPDHFGAEYLLALSRLRVREYAAAREGLTRCLKQRPDFAWPRLLRGFAEMELLNFPAALADLDEVLRNPPDRMASYVALVNRGVLAVKQRRWQPAEADFQRAIALNPDAFAAHLNLAVLHKQRAELPTGSGPTDAALVEWRRELRQRAVSALDRAIDRRDDVAALYQERGRLLLLLGESQRARQDLVRAVALAHRVGPSLVADLLELARLNSESGDYRQAVRTLDALLALRPDEAQAHYLRGMALVKLGEADSAARSLDRYLERAPEKVSPRSPEQTRRLGTAYRIRGLLHARGNDYRAALECYAEGLRVQRDPGTLSDRGWAYLMLGAALLGREDFEELLRLRPGDADALIGRADAAIKLGDWQQASRDVASGVAQGGRNATTLYRAARVHAQILARLGPAEPGTPQRQQAERSAERAVSLLADALAQTPRDERQGFWRDVVQKDPALEALRKMPALARLAP